MTSIIVATDSGRKGKCITRMPNRRPPLLILAADYLHVVRYCHGKKVAHLMPKTIRFQLIVAVNTAMALLFAVFLLMDYRRELAERLAERQMQMEEEATTLAEAVLRLRHHGLDSVQEYIDAVCGQMHESDSPGHHIALRLESAVIQAAAHQRASPEMFDAILAASSSPGHRAKIANQEIVVGSHEQQGVTVFVSEYLSNVRRAARGDMLRHFGGILVLGLLAASIANIVLVRIVVRPLDRLVGTVQEIAAGRVGAQSGAFDSVELSYLADAINSMSSTLAAADRQRRAEMEKARRIQQHLMPTAPQIPGLSITHVYQPATEVAGDYYDALALPDLTYLVAIADIAGHGVPAALEAAILKAVLMHSTEHCSRPDEVLASVNHRFTAVCPSGDFASMFILRWKPETATLEYASAGHEPGWFLPAAGDLRALSSTGTLLGIDRNSTWETETLEVAPGDRLLLATDGVTEAFSAEDELFGRERLTRLFAGSRASPMSEVLQQISDALTTHQAGRPPADDITMVLVEFT